MVLAVPRLAGQRRLLAMISMDRGARQLPTGDLRPANHPADTACCGWLCSLGISLGTAGFTLLITFGPGGSEQEKTSMSL